MLGASPHSHIGMCHPNPGPLFVFNSAAPLTTACLVSNLQAELKQASLDDFGHSFQIGAATTAAQQVLEDAGDRAMRTRHTLNSLSTAGKHSTDTGPGPLTD